MSQPALISKDQIYLDIENFSISQLRNLETYQLGKNGQIMLPILCCQKAEDCIKIICVNTFKSLTTDLDLGLGFDWATLTHAYFLT